MNRQDAEKTITEYLKPIFGFALKRCKSTQDAEDLSQEIVMRAFRAFLIRDDIADVGKFIWTVAYNALSNYYRDAESERADHNFLLWSLIPYIAAWSGEKLMDDSISFEDVATIRPDGGYNIVHASVVPEEMVLPEDYVYMKKWDGPMWNEFIRISSKR